MTKREYDEMAGDRHLMTEAEFQEERRARDRMLRETEERFWRSALGETAQKQEG